MSKFQVLREKVTRFMLARPGSAYDEVLRGTGADPVWLAWAIKSLVDDGMVADLRSTEYVPAAPKAKPSWADYAAKFGR